MNTLEELKDYCQEEKPVGALMLTGEWGCGKTYLVDNVLSKELESYVFLRVSLFGIGTVNELREEVKRRWFYKQVEANEQVSKILEKVLLMESAPIKKLSSTESMKSELTTLAGKKDALLSVPNAEITKIHLEI